MLRTVVGKRGFFAWVAISLVPAALHAQVQIPTTSRPVPSDVERACTHLGLDKRDIRIRRADLARLTDNRRPGSVLGALFEEPLSTKAFAQHVRATLLEELETPAAATFTSPYWSGFQGLDRSVERNVHEAAVADIISKLSRWSDHVVRRTLLGNPIKEDMEAAAKPAAMLDAIGALHERAGEPLTATERDRLSVAVKALPVPIQRAAALLLRVAARAMTARDRAIRKLDKTDLADTTALAGCIDYAELKHRLTDGLRDRLLGFEPGPLIAAAQELALAAGVSTTLLRACEPAPAEFTWKTPYGTIRVDAKGHTCYEGNTPYLLILDTVGDDLYHAGAAAMGIQYPVSILIDTEGDDRYMANHDPITPATASRPADQEFVPIPAQEEPAVFGAAILGVAILYDARGNDTYEAVRRCMGHALFGVGVLADLDGNDHYEAVADAQGAAQAGIGLLVDAAGDDRYHCYTRSQGFGSLDGLGCLLDAAGDDRYAANTTDIRFPAAQSAEQNDSMAQGVGCGHRADYLDGHSFNGGIGLLVDGAGSDDYECGVFGQGAGYWFGVGLCIDAAGNDRYRGAWYVQGAAAHFAAGALVDEAGHDHYEATLATSLGTGHDLSLGFLADLAGNDRYVAANLTMGSGNASGLGILVDVSGDDDYEIPAQNALGNANPGKGVRAMMPTLGLFLDGGGRDRYSQAHANDESIWGNGPHRAFQQFSTPRYAIGLDTTMTEQQFNRFWAPP